MKSSFKRKLKRFLFPTEPKTTFCLAYLVPGKSDLVELHKQACWLSYTSKPIAVRAPLALYRLFLWYLLHAWRYCFKTWLNNRKK